MKRPIQCNGCPFYDGGKRDEFVPFVGPMGAPLAVIAESPGEEECPAEEPLVGRSGKMFNTALRYAGVKREDTLIGNTVLCRPPYPYAPEDGKWAGAIAHCGRTHVRPTLERASAKAAVLIGGVSLLAHTGMRAFTVNRGGYDLTLNGIEGARGSSYLTSELKLAGGVALPHSHSLPPLEREMTLVPTLHPAYIMRGNQHLKPLLALDIERADRWAHGKQSAPFPGVASLHLYADPDEVTTVVKGGIVFDVENDAAGRVTMIGIGDIDTQQVYVTSLTDSIRALLARPGSVKVAHNMAYDLKMIGSEVGKPWADTIMAAALVQPMLPRALSDVTSLYGGDGYFYWKDIEENPRTLAVTRARLGAGAPSLLRPGDVARLYNALDVWWTMRNWPILVDEMRHYDVIKLFWDMHMPLMDELIEIEKVGMMVDVAWMGKRREMAEEEYLKMGTHVEETVAVRNEVRREKVKHESEAKVREAEEAVAREGETCSAHPEFQGETKRSKCKSCLALWENRRPARRVLSKVLAGTRNLAGRVTTFDPDSDLHWRWLVYAPVEEGGLGLSSPMRTAKKSKPSLNKDALRGLMASAKLPEGAHALLMARYKMGQLRSRISKYLSLPVAKDGRVHPPYSQHKTINFRTSSGLDDTDEDKPNSPYAVNGQNFPEDCRDVVVAGEGNVLVNFDLSAIEDWTTALDVWKLTGRRDYFDLLSSGVDIHQMTADMIAKLGGMFVTRHQGKTGRHGWKYGMKEKKLAITRAGEGITYAMAKELIRTLDYLHPDVVEWKARKLEAVRRHPTDRNPFGHVCHFTLTRARVGEGVEPDEPNEVLSWFPSSTATDIAKRAWLHLGAMRKNGMLPGRIINHAHDNFLFETPEGSAPFLIEVVKVVMEKPVEQLKKWHPDGQPFVPRAEVQIGYNWGPRIVKPDGTVVNPNGLRKLKDWEAR